MTSKMFNLRKFGLGVIMITAIMTGVAIAEDIIITYPVTENWKRKTEPSGNIYEFEDESLYGDQYNHYGRTKLAFQGTSYKTWLWGNINPADAVPDTQVLLTEYSGIYTPPNNNVWSDVQVSERQVSYLFDHHGQVANLNTVTNGWIMREKILYANDGVTINEKYFYDATGKLQKEIHSAAGGFHAAHTYYTYDYHTSPGMETVIHYKNVYSYDPAQEANILNGTAAGTFLESYEYISSTYMVKRDASGKITTLLIDSLGNSHPNTYLDPANNILHAYQWDASWNLVSVTKYYPASGGKSGAIEICTPTSPSDPVWPLKKKIVPDDGFIKGVNLPWVNYGYDIGMTQGGDHFGFSRNLSTLYSAMEKRKGDTVRIFLFNDLRAGINFAADGTPLSFTDKVYEDMDALIACAKALGIKLMPVLFDYTIADGGATAPNADHPDLFTDPAKRTALVNIMKIFIQKYGLDPSIYAWDIMNEPEGAHDLGGVAMTDMQAFMQAFITMIHTETPGALVTVGSRNRNEMFQYWTGMGLDLYQFHYYGTMEGITPLDHVLTAPELALLGGKPVIAGEMASTDITNKLNILHKDGYAGSLFWDDGGTFNDEHILSAAEYQQLQDWFFGTQYTYYTTSHRLESKTMSTADQYGNVYYHYTDESYYDNGTPGDPTDDYGRVDKQVLGSVAADGAIAYAYIY
ncbi:MAG: hypothetical protein PHS37_02570, partial [Candidatus Omnitrophica bacterium]|nr:hypothetical protein [Candidatus Omnitrophota bacterium]